MSLIRTYGATNNGYLPSKRSLKDPNSASTFSIDGETHGWIACPEIQTALPMVVASVKQSEAPSTDNFQVGHVNEETINGERNGEVPSRDINCPKMQNDITSFKEAEKESTITSTKTDNSMNLEAPAENTILPRANKVLTTKVKDTKENVRNDKKAVEEGASRSGKLRPQLQRVPWEQRLAQLEEYKKKHHNLLIPIRYKVNPSLGKFVHNTREQFKLYHKKAPSGYKKKCSLTAARIQQLNEIGFVWSTERAKHQSEDWQHRFDQLKAYKGKHGNCLVPHGYSEDPSFAEWVHRQRTTYANMLKDKSSVNDIVRQRMDQLLGLGFNFTVHADKWTDHFKQLTEFKHQHGHCQVPTHYPENPKLGRWVHTQRHQRRLQLKGKKSCMTAERVELLTSLGFSWEVRACLERGRGTSSPQGGRSEK